MMLLVVAGLVVQLDDRAHPRRPRLRPGATVVRRGDRARWKSVPTARLADAAAARRRAGAIPGAEAAAMARGARNPLSTDAPFDIAGRESTARDRPTAGIVVTTADYFQVFGVPIVAGRRFAASDAATAAPVTVISGSGATILGRGGAGDWRGRATRPREPRRPRRDGDGRGQGHGQRRHRSAVATDSVHPQRPSADPRMQMVVRSSAPAAWPRRYAPPSGRSIPTCPPTNSVR